MIIEKALEKAKKKKNKPFTVIKDESPKTDAAQATETDPRVCPSCRMVELDSAFIHSQRCLGDKSDHTEIENYKTLRTRLLQIMVAQRWNTLMLTSACAGEGKTLTALNLAFTFSHHYDHTVLLVDCDLRKQSIHKYLGFSNSLNIIDHLVDNIPLHNTMVRPGEEKIVVISGERTIDSGAELLGSAQMSKLVNELKNRFKDRIIIFDLPPVLFASDALVSAAWVDSILMVVEYGKTSIKDVQKSLDGFPKDKIMGFVLNRGKIPKNDYRKYGYNRK